jgi:hypothetical protein
MAVLIDYLQGSISLRSICVLVLAFIPLTQLSAQETLRAHSEVLGSNAPFSFPEKVVVGPDKNIYFLDTTLSGIFVQDFKTAAVKRLCGAESLRSPSDLSVDVNGYLWVLNQNGSKISRLDRKCATTGEASLTNPSLRIANNSFGEVIVLNETGPALFALFSPQGKLLRSFGDRIKYAEEIATNELSDGHIVPDRNGGFFFSFNYPPLIRHYSRTGRLLNEFKPESDISIDPPNFTVRSVANSVSVSSKYQILVLDMATDDQSRLYLLISGKNKIPALTQGTSRLVVSNSKGRVLKSVTLANNYHRVLAGNGNLYLLRNRPPLRLDRYEVF